MAKMTNKVRKAKERAIKQSQGLIRFEIWIKPEWKEKIKQYIKRMK